MKVKVFGQKRTGTNLAYWLMRQIPGVELIDICDSEKTHWKHAPAQWDSRYRHVVLTVKNPFAWLASNKRWQHGVVDIEQYVNIEEANERFRRLDPQRVLRQRYEDVLDGSALPRLAEWCGHPEIKLELPKKQCDCFGNLQGNTFDMEYYEDRVYLADCSDMEHDKIRSLCAGTVIPRIYPEFVKEGLLLA